MVNARRRLLARPFRFANDRRSQRISFADRADDAPPEFSYVPVARPPCAGSCLIHPATVEDRRTLRLEELTNSTFMKAGVPTAIRRKTRHNIRETSTATRLQRQPEEEGIALSGSS